MSFIIGKIAGELSSPSIVLLLCCVFGTMLVWRRPRPIGRALLVIGVGGFVAVYLLPLDKLALLPLEDRFPQVANPPAYVDGIIVLGGATMPAMTADRGIPSLNNAAERMTTGVALALRYPAAKLVFTGGNGVMLRGAVSEADTARLLFQSLGIPASRIVLEGQSRTTWENAVLTKAMVNPQPGQTWILVTSAMHMPRSVGIFRKVGWDVLPWPVAYKSGHDPSMWLPWQLGSSLDNLDDAVHEWIGLLGYWLEGRTSALFPGPEKVGAAYSGKIAVASISIIASRSTSDCTPITAMAGNTRPMMSCQTDPRSACAAR
jgi:uncharacterized SAM-binding protein YcdF (DUF218 family)